MKHTIPILQDKLFVLQVKSSYEVILDIINSTKEAPLTMEEGLDIIKKVEDKYMKELIELRNLVEKKKNKQLDIESEIESIKSSTI